MNTLDIQLNGVLTDAAGVSYAFTGTGTAIEAVSPPPGGNLLADPNAFNLWNKAGVTVTPDAVGTASRLTESSTTIQHYVAPSAGIAFVSGTSYTFSFKVKAETAGFAQLVFPGAAFGLNAYVTFDVAGGVVGSAASGVVASSIEPLGDGTYLLSAAAIASASATAVPSFFMANAADMVRAANYAGTGLSCLVSDAKVEVTPPAEEEPVEPPPPPVSSIPMSPADTRFAANTAGSTANVSSGTYANKTWNDNFASGSQCFVWTGNGNDVLNLSQCYINGREGPRIGADDTPTATLNIDQTYINCAGKGDDHADCIQAYSPGGVCLLNITNSYLRSYNDTEAQQKYGAGFIGSAGIFWADNMQGEVRVTNTVIHGSGRGVAIYADTGTTRVSFEDVFFVPGPGGWTGFDFDIRATGGTLIIDKWVNVREATIVDGQLVPGALIPQP